MNGRDDWSKNGFKIVGLLLPYLKMTLNFADKTSKETVLQGRRKEVVEVRAVMHVTIYYPVPGGLHLLGFIRSLAFLSIMPQRLARAH